MAAPDYSVWRTLGMVSSVGLTLAFCVLLGAGAGILLDRMLGIPPWGLIGGLALGSVAGFVNAWRMVKPLIGKQP
jgi:ATP synthase protein I